MIGANMMRRTVNVAEQVHCAISPYRRGIALAVYTGVAVLSYALAFFLRFELTWPHGYTETVLLTTPILLLIRIGSVWTFGLTLGRWRFVGIRDVARLVLATTTGSVAFFFVVSMLPVMPGVPRSIIAIEWVLTTYATAGFWISYRFIYEVLRKHAFGLEQSEERHRALIVGAGEAGSRLVRDMLRSPTSYIPVGFVDDDAMKWGTTLHGVEVIGSIDEVKRIAEHTNADELIIALPSAGPQDLREVVERCSPTELPHKVLPGIAEVLSGNVSVRQLREVKIEDLLGRDPVKLSLPELERVFRGATVLVTGAAGSIGSELARQIALHGPKTLLILDQAESDLYFLDLQLREDFDEVDVVPIVGDVLDRSLVETLCGEYKPDFVFHAAAYKHVPLMESNGREAIRNNVIGTWHVACAAGAAESKKFVLISTDKAVRPANIMGATKRVAELLTLECQEDYPDTWYTAVRFGNVLGSQGSVLPLFKRQLAEGKALTVTHPEVTRYFMTVSEAVQLVLQASLLPETRGRIAMLEMGEPVRILDLAENLLRLSGVHGEDTGRIEFVGLRPGEKLHEDLRAPDEEPVATEVSKIQVLRTNGPECGGSVLERVRRWSAALQNADEDPGAVREEVWELSELPSEGEADPDRSMGKVAYTDATST